MSVSHFSLKVRPFHTPRIALVKAFESPTGSAPMNLLVSPLSSALSTYQRDIRGVKVPIEKCSPNVPAVVMAD